MTDLLPWVVFFISAAVLVAAGSQLAAYGDRLSKETGIGGLWIGVLLVATATSLPEIVTSSAAAWIDEIDLAAGGIFGSGMSNMMILALLDLLYRRRRVWRSLSDAYLLVAALAIALTSLAGALTVAGLNWSIGHVGLTTVFIAAVYLLGLRVVYRQEYLKARERASGAEESSIAETATGLRRASRRTLAGLAASAAVVIVASPFVAGSASEIAEATGINASFVGATFLAVSTSLPELVTGLAAIRLASYDLAAGNLFGSNAFNIFALLFVDAAYRPGPALSALSPASTTAAFAAILLMAVGMMGIIFRAERRGFLQDHDPTATVS